MYALALRSLAASCNWALLRQPVAPSSARALASTGPVISSRGPGASRLSQPSSSRLQLARPFDQASRFATKPPRATLSVKVLSDAKLLEDLGVSRAELFYYLNNYKSAHGGSFAVIKVGGAVMEEQMEELVRALSLMRRLDLMPIVIHGAGPQLNEALQKEGIVSNYHQGLRVTSPKILQVARSVFSTQNLALVEALEASGVRARPIQQGVFEAAPIDLATVGLVGDVTAVDMRPVISAMEAGCIPVLTCMGQDKNGQLLNINADMAARELSLAAKPTKVVYLSGKGGLYDAEGTIINQINISDDYETLMNEPWFKHGDRLKLREVKSVLEGLPFTSSVSIVSPALLAQELFTHAGSGTNIQDREKIFQYASLDEVDLPRLHTLIESSFDEHLKPDFWEKIRGKIETIFISEHYRSAAIVTDEYKNDASITALGGEGVAYLDKFAVLQQFQNQGVGKRVWEKVCAKYPQLVWRTRLSNPIASWYFENADGTMANDKWTVFWTGLTSFPLIEKYVSDLFARESSFSTTLHRVISAPEIEPPETLPSRRFSLGLIGARGYTGGDFLELLDDHPHIELRVASSRQFEGRRLCDVLPNVKSELEVVNLTPEQVRDMDDDIDIWVIALPNGCSQEYIEALPPKAKILDLSADHRFNSEWVYGLPESRGQRQRIRTSTRVANPGCYATGAQLTLLPLLRDPNRTSPSVIFGSPSVIGISGYSGAGTTPSPRNDTVRLADNLMAYGLGGHIHEREISHQLGPYGLKQGVDFVPHVASWFRGIHLTTVVHLNVPLDRQQLVDRYMTYYKDEPLVRITTEIPEVKDINRSNLVQIGGFGVNSKNDRVIMATTIDNLRKGAAAAALQNINLMLGLNELQNIPPQ
ncbi:MAG: acetylglutamate kinase [archaeon]|nr:acetylglutamate kinase [archaeon]